MPVSKPTPILTASKYKFRLALMRLKLFDRVELAIAESTDQELKLAWHYADEYRSDDPLVLQLGLVLGKTETEIWAVFELTQTL